jgi:hypothetical protein
MNADCVKHRTQPHQLHQSLHAQISALQPSNPLRRIPPNSSATWLIPLNCYTVSHMQDPNRDPHALTCTRFHVYSRNQPLIMVSLQSIHLSLHETEPISSACASSCMLKGNLCETLHLVVCASFPSCGVWNTGESSSTVESKSLEVKSHKLSKTRRKQRDKSSTSLGAGTPIKRQ